MTVNLHLSQPRHVISHKFDRDMMMSKALMILFTLVGGEFTSLYFSSQIAYANSDVQHH